MWPQKNGIHDIPDILDKNLGPGLERDQSHFGLVIASVSDGMQFQHHEKPVKTLWNQTGIPSGYVKIAIEAMAIEIVDFPINSMVIFHSYVSLPEGTLGIWWNLFPNSETSPWT